VPAPSRRLQIGCLAFVAACLIAPAQALPPPSSPTTATATTPSPHPSAQSYLPAGSPLDFVLDEKIDSAKTQPGSTISIHLAKALVVGGVELAPSGAPATLKIVSTSPALAPDVDGAIRIELNPLALPGHGILPVSPAHEYINIDRTAGQQTTGGIADSAVEVFIPLYAIAKQFRKGRELTLPRGSVLRAHTDASIDASAAPAIVIATPAAFQLNQDAPHSSFTPIPLYTASEPFPRPRSHRGVPSPSPTAAPTPSASPSPGAGTDASPAAAPALTPTPTPSSSPTPIPSPTPTA